MLGFFKRQLARMICSNDYFTLAFMKLLFDERLFKKVFSEGEDSGDLMLIDAYVELVLSRDEFVQRFVAHPRFGEGPRRIVLDHYLLYRMAEDRKLFSRLYTDRELLKKIAASGDFWEALTSDPEIWDRRSRAHAATALEKIHAAES